MYIELPISLTSSDECGCSTSKSG
jgi:hypothetical protein